MKSLFEKEAFDEIKSRLEQLQETTPKQWGKMEPGQMLHHCQGPLNIVLGKENYGLKPSWFATTFFKKSMYSDKPWKKNLPTLKQFKEKTSRDFNKEKTTLSDLLNEFDSQRDRNDWGPHPTFGDLTKEQWGKMQYKHLDHHFRQFGI